MIAQKKNFENIVKDDFSFMFQIDEVRQENASFVLDGWAFKLGVDSVAGRCEVWLFDLDKEKIIYPKTKYVKRNDVNGFFECDIDYSNSGIIATFDLRKLDIYENNYEVLVSDNVSKQVYRTGTFISNGELMYCSVDDCDKLDVAGTELESIVENGTLRVWRPDIGMYVYQYEGKLYWIADENYNFESDRTTYIEYQMNTTQKDKLPSYMKDNGWYWGNEGFIFEKEEIICNSGVYRVAARDITPEYSKTICWTGYYVDGWLWQNNFRLKY